MLAVLKEKGKKKRKQSPALSDEDTSVRPKRKIDTLSMIQDMEKEGAEAEEKGEA